MSNSRYYIRLKTKQELLSLDKRNEECPGGLYVYGVLDENPDQAFWLPEQNFFMLGGYLYGVSKEGFPDYWVKYFSKDGRLFEIRNFEVE